MGVRSKIPALDARTPAEMEADEAIARAAESGNWEGLARAQICTEAGARQILEHRQGLAPNSMLAEVTQQPFRWKERVFRILRCEYADGKAHVEVTPDNPEFAAEVKKRIEENRFHYLPHYQGYGFISFPEDHQLYRE